MDVIRFLDELIAHDIIINLIEAWSFRPTLPATGMPLLFCHPEEYLEYGEIQKMEIDRALSFIKRALLLTSDYL